MNPSSSLTNHLLAATAATTNTSAIVAGGDRCEDNIAKAQPHSTINNSNVTPPATAGVTSGATTTTTGAPPPPPIQVDVSSIVVQALLRQCQQHLQNQQPQAQHHHQPDSAVSSSARHGNYPSLTSSAITTTTPVPHHPSSPPGQQHQQQFQQSAILQQHRQQQQQQQQEPVQLLQQLILHKEQQCQQLRAKLETAYKFLEALCAEKAHLETEKSQLEDMLRKLTGGCGVGAPGCGSQQQHQQQHQQQQADGQQSPCGETTCVSMAQDEQQFQQQQQLKHLVNWQPGPAQLDSSGVLQPGDDALASKTTSTTTEPGQVESRQVESMVVSCPQQQRQSLDDDGCESPIRRMSDQQHQPPQQPRRRLSQPAGGGGGGEGGCGGDEDVSGGCATTTSMTVLDDGSLITDEDVLCGRNRTAHCHTGNHRFRELIRMNREQYQATRLRGEKYDTVQKVISIIHGRGGRFLELSTGCHHHCNPTAAAQSQAARASTNGGGNSSGDEQEVNENADGGHWAVMSPERAYEKVSKSLRMARPLRSSKKGSFSVPTTTSSSASKCERSGISNNSDSKKEQQRLSLSLSTDHVGTTVASAALNNLDTLAAAAAGMAISEQKSATLEDAAAAPMIEDNVPPSTPSSTAEMCPIEDSVLRSKCPKTRKKGCDSHAARRRIRTAIP